MRKAILTLAVLALIAGPAFAHCGKCGVGDEHSHASEASNNDIVAVAISAGSFNTLVAAVQAAGLVETLQSDGPFTVFAPTDEAFAKLPAGTVENLIANPDQLKQILLYHVVSGKVTAGDVVKLSDAATAEGSDVMIKVNGNGVMINNANVIQTDVMASNGIIHVIDTVLIPTS
ncbi:MAG: fasciclin domain-containing protein [Acidobacteriota bacterium]|nr:fasciclin domain-containing protein [Acidobacteriota bacterium]